MSKYSRRRRQRPMYLGKFYLNPHVQYLSTVVSAIALAGFVFSGFLLFRFTDEEDLISRGKVQLAEGKVAFAAKTFRTLVNNHPRNYEGHLLLGQAYLALENRRQAEKEFQIAASLRGNSDNAPEIALSKVSMAQGEYDDAEAILKKSWQRNNRQDRDVKQALMELYEQWGDTLSNKEAKDHAAIVEKYELALHYVGDYQSQQAIEEKLIDAINRYTDDLMARRDYEKAIHHLKMSLRFKYLPDTLVQIAEAYGQMDKLDESIEWYRKAFDANPKAIGLRLTNMLVEKGQALVKEKKPEEAEKYFKEADQISAKAKVPLHNLYPVTVNNVSLEFNFDSDTGQMAPEVRVHLSNDAARDLSFLVLKAEFVSGEETIAQVTEQVASPDKPLLAEPGKKGTRSFTLKPDYEMNVHALKDNKLTVKISIAYQEGERQEWKVKSIQEAVLRQDGQTETVTKPV